VAPGDPLLAPTEAERAVIVVLEWALLVCLVSFGWLAWIVLRRPDASPVAFWIAGWISASAGGLILAMKEGVDWAHFLSYPLGTLFPALLLAGAFVLVGRRPPAWLLPLGVAFGAARAALSAFQLTSAAYAVALAVEPVALLAAAFLAFRATPPAGASLAQRLLGPSFLFLAAAGAFHSAWLMQEEVVAPGLFAFWIMAAPPALAVQLQAGADRARQARRRELEEHGEVAVPDGIVHDVSQLLAVILGHVRLLGAELDPASPLRARVSRIRAATEDASELADRMLRAEALPPAPAPPLALVGRRRGRILVVDDEPWALELAREFLERAGHTVLTASGGRAGIAAFREHAGEIAAVVLDPALGDVNGDHVLVELERLRPGVPVLIAADESAPPASSLAQRSAAGLLRKPWAPEDLVEGVNAVLARAKREGERS
jgi:CheY-like chemotaxis protein